MDIKPVVTLDVWNGNVDEIECSLPDGKHSLYSSVQFEALQEKVAAYDKWLSKGVYFTDDEYKKEVAENKEKLEKLKADIVSLESENATLRKIISENGAKIVDDQFGL